MRSWIAKHIWTQCRLWALRPKRCWFRLLKHQPIDLAALVWDEVELKCAKWSFSRHLPFGPRFFFPRIRISPISFPWARVSGPSMAIRSRHDAHTKSPYVCVAGHIKQRIRYHVWSLKQFSELEKWLQLKIRRVLGGHMAASIHVSVCSCPYRQWAPSARCICSAL